VVANIPRAPQKPGKGKEESRRWRRESRRWRWRRESRRKIPEKPPNPKNLASLLSTFPLAVFSSLSSSFPYPIYLLPFFSCTPTFLPLAPSVSSETVYLLQSLFYFFILI
jgi:hypothetical protein